MSEPEKEFPVDEKIDREVGGEALQSLIENPVNGQNSQSCAEISVTGSSELVENSVALASSEGADKDIAPALESQNDGRDTVATGEEENRSEIKPNGSQTDGQDPVSMEHTADHSVPNPIVSQNDGQIVVALEKTEDSSNPIPNGTQSDGKSITAMEQAANCSGPYPDGLQNDGQETVEVKQTEDCLAPNPGGLKNDGQVTVMMDQTENCSAPNPSGSQTDGQDPVAVEKTENSDPNLNSSSNVKIGEESELVNAQVENGRSSHEMDVKDDHQSEDNHCDETPLKQEEYGGAQPAHLEVSNQSYRFDHFLDGDDSGSEEEQTAFMKELENFFKERSMEFKPPKFYGEGLNCLKLWRQVTRLGGYDQVTSCKLWRQVGESFRPPKTCTTVSWTFRGFYEKALLEYEKHKIRTGELQVAVSNLSDPMVLDSQVGGIQSSGSGRARRDAAARAMQGWHSQRLLCNGEVGDPIIKDKSSASLLKRDKHLKSFASLKRKKPSSLEHTEKVARSRLDKPQVDIMVVDAGVPADWVKINVRTTKDCYEVYALVPGLLREEVQVQSDPAGRLIISGEPEQPDNPWGVTPFKKVITLPSRIDPHQTSAVVTLHGQLFVRAPFESSES
ncbi:AT-rich interactive domain-containing protein 3-like [Typha latifolia]|uniref:AT-rich interactive domain-containing protein 3-like n=1 Tax=Typha latifolia TaxID=4733 RepID=UPI003C2B3AAF